MNTPNSAENPRIPVEDRPVIGARLQTVLEAVGSVAVVENASTQGDDYALAA
jgi:hypothetical protein